LIGVFFLLHGLVHLLYVGHSLKFFELQPEFGWPDGSWVFSKILGNETIRVFASLALGLAALAFLVSGVGLLLQQTWWRPVTQVAAFLSAAIFLLFWDGGFQKLDAKGGVAILIDLAILAVVWFAHGPDLDFG
jgi:hypothetical protein